jgi:O-antigen/teichoic acid export membrane protein
MRDPGSDDEGEAVILHADSVDSRSEAGPVVSRRDLRGIKLRVRQSQSAWSAATNYSIAFSALLGGIAVARSLGPIGRGQLAAAVVWSVALSSLATLGLPASLAYHVAKYPSHARQYLRMSLVAGVGAGVACAAFDFVFLTFVLAHRQHISTGVAASFSLWVFLLTVAIYPIAYLQGTSQFSRWNVCRAMTNAGPGIAMILLWLLNILSIQSVAFCYVVASLATIAMGFFFVALLHSGRSASSHGAEILEEEGISNKSFWLYGVRNFPSVMMATANSRVDQFILTVVASPAQLGIYVVASSPSALLVPLVNGFSSVHQISIAMMDDVQQATLLAHRMLRRGATIAFCSSAVVAILLPFAIPLVFGQKFQASIAPAEILVWGGCFFAIDLVLAAALLGLGRPGIIGIGEGAGAAITAAGVLLTYRHGLVLVGVAASAGFASTSVIGSVALLSSKFVPRHQRHEAQCD